jgi:hypothetical protein
MKPTLSAEWRALFDRLHCRPSHPSKGLNFSFQGDRLDGKFSVLQGVPVAHGSPTTGTVHSADARPRTAGARHRSPLRFDLARHLDAWCIGQLCMGLILRFFPRPHLLGWRADIADDRLPALGDMDVLNGHLLLAAASVSLERLDLRCECPCELIEGIRGAVLLWDIVNVRQASGEGSKLTKHRENEEIEGRTLRAR